jgi:WD40 repeat protein
MKRMTVLVVAVAWCAAYRPASAWAQGAPASPGPAGQAKAGKANAVREFKADWAVATVACSPDGKLIAIANGGPSLVLQTDGTSRLAGDWRATAQVIDAMTGKMLALLKLTNADEDAVLAATPRVSHVEVTALAFTPDGSQLAVGTSTGQIKLFDAHRGKLLRSLDDVKAKLLDKESTEEWKALSRAMGSVASLAFSPDGKLLASCGDSFVDFSRVFNSRGQLGERTTGPGRIKVWDVNTGVLKHDLVGHSHARAVAYSPDGKLLASAGTWTTEDESGAGVILWDAQASKDVRRVAIKANGTARSLVFSPDGKQLAVCSPGFGNDKSNEEANGNVTVADVASGAVTWTKKMAGLSKAVGILPNDSSVIMLCDGGLWFRDLQTGEIEMIVHPGQGQGKGARWDDLAVAKRGHMQVMGGVNADRKGTVYVLDPDREGDEPVQAKPGL